MKAGFLFLATFAVTVAVGALFMRSSRAAEPVDVFVTPAPAASQGTTAAILPPGTYFAERPDGVRLSGWVHSPSVSRFPILKKAPSASPKAKMPQHDPQLRFVPAQPQPQPVRPARPRP